MPSTKILETMSYDPASKTVVGLGYNAVAKTRTLVRLSTNGTLTTIADVKVRQEGVACLLALTMMAQGYFIESGGIAALDTKQGIAYFELQPTTTNTSTPFSLVGVDIGSGTVRACLQ